MKTINLANGATRTFGAISVDSVTPHTFKKDRMSAQIRQQIMDIYPGGKPNGDLFETKDFGFKPSEYPSTRVAFVDCPIGSTKESIQAKIDALTAAGKMPNISRTMSLNPILGENHVLAIKNGITTKAKIAEGQRAFKQVLEDGKPTGKTELLLYGDKPFYRVSAFNVDFVADVDMRPAESGSVTEKAEVVAEVQLETVVK